MSRLIGVGIISIIIAMIAAAVILAFLAYDYFFHQKRFFKGREYRREYGKYSLQSYMKKSDVVKNPDWLTQSNKGFKPKHYIGKHNRINYKTDIECIIPKKGL